MPRIWEGVFSGSIDLLESDRCRKMLFQHALHWIFTNSMTAFSWSGFRTFRLAAAAGLHYALSSSLSAGHACSSNAVNAERNCGSPMIDAFVRVMVGCETVKPFANISQRVASGEVHSYPIFAI